MGVFGKSYLVAWQYVVPTAIGGEFFVPCQEKRGGLRDIASATGMAYGDGIVVKGQRGQAFLPVNLARQECLAS
jgi:hypothetical protein